MIYILIIFENFISFFFVFVKYTTFLCCRIYITHVGKRIYLLNHIQQKIINFNQLNDISFIVIIKTLTQKNY